MDYETNLDPEIAKVLAQLPLRQPLDASTLNEFRENGARVYPALDPDVAHHDHHVGDANCLVRVHEPLNRSGLRPCLYWIHGGGYIAGSFLKDEDLIDRWVRELGCVVVSPNYRLAPENPFPKPLDDCFEGLLWVIEHQDDLGIDGSRIVIGGLSAGGGLAAALTWLARDRHLPGITHQLLIYPMMDDRFRLYPSSEIDTDRWGTPFNTFGWTAYLGQEPGATSVPDYAVAARSQNLTNLPTTFIGAGTLDILRDEAVHYAMRLLENGVDLELHLYAGAPHGFDRVAPDASVSKRLSRDVSDFLSRAMNV